MVMPLLQTKLNIPPLRSNIVPRPGLLERLKTNLQLKLTLVAAPAGYGKTTLLSEGIRYSRMPVCWLTLDENDNDPARFLFYVISAMQTLRADIGKSALELLQSSQATPVEFIITTIINEMNKVDEEFALVLDDYHMIEAQPVHDTVNFLLNHLPPQVHLVIASRVDPPLLLTRLRAQGQLTELRADDLRFSLEEATVFLNDVMSLALSDEDIAALESRTEGWIASLQLAGISMQQRENISAFIAGFSGSNRFIMDYLIEEVLRRQEADTHSFLLETAILNRFTASLCDSVTGRNDSRERLAQLEAANLFIVPLDDERQWYRYHHLFADLLRNQLMQSQQDRMTELHLSASRWFEQEGLINEAIHYAFEGGDFERAADLIEPVALTTVMQSNCSTVLSWLEKLPNGLITSRPWLCFSGALANQLTGNQDAVEPLLQYAESAMSGAEEEQPTGSFPDHSRVRGYVITIRITRSLLDGDNQRAIELCHEAFKYLPYGDQAARAAVTGNLGVAYLSEGDLPAARHFLEEAETLGQAGGHLYISLASMSHLADIHRVQGHLSQAANKCREALRLGARWGGDEPLPTTGSAYVALARILYEWNDINGALHHVKIGIKLAERGGVIRSIVIGYLWLAWQNHALGNNKAMIEALQQIEKIPSKSINNFTHLHVSAWKARISLAQGDINAVHRWADSQEPKLDLHNIPDYWSELPYLTLVRFYIAQGEVDEIPCLLEQLLQRAEAQKRTGSVIEILALQSIALQAQGEEDQALATLERSLSLAEPEGYIRTFIDEGEPMAKLLRLAASRGIARDYVKKLLSSFHPGADSRTLILSARDVMASSPLVEPLSERELQVLQLIIYGMSNREIAEKLIIGNGTVKTHINNIYTKLDVQSRTQAIARSRDLKLFEQ